LIFHLVLLILLVSMQMIFLICSMQYRHQKPLLPASRPALIPTMITASRRPPLHQDQPWDPRWLLQATRLRPRPTAAPRGNQQLAPALPPLIHRGTTWLHLRDRDPLRPAQRRLLHLLDLLRPMDLLLLLLRPSHHHRHPIRFDELDCNMGFASQRCTQMVQ
jgi:hypothetical protein